MGNWHGRLLPQAVFLSSFLFFAFTPYNSMAEGPASEKFSDPGYTVEMPSGWDDRPIEYMNGEKEEDLSIVINQQLSAVLVPIVDRFTAERKVKISVQIGTCGISAGTLSRKEVDMGGFCCPPGRIDRLPGLEFHTLGITPLLIIVHKDVDVDNVSLDQARALFSGKITNWSELGGRNLPVRPMGMLHCKKRPGHWRLILGSADYFSPELKVTGSIEDTIDTVASTPGSVGFEIMMNILKLDKADDLKVLKVDGYDPMDMSRLKAARYPFYRVMNVTTWREAGVSKELAVKLLSYMMKEIEGVEPRQGIVASAQLREAGWIFRGSELIGEPAR